MQTVSHNENETRALAAAVAAQCAAGDCILLDGDLGAGKTTFARGFIHALSENAGDVVSPTFTLAQSYPTRHGWPVWHFDLYRLKDARELAEIGLDDALQSGVSLVEWPELAEAHLPTRALRVRFGYGEKENERRITLEGGGWQERLKPLGRKASA